MIPLGRQAALPSCHGSHSFSAAPLRRGQKRLRSRRSHAFGSRKGFLWYEMDRNFTKSEADMGNASLPPDFLPFTNDFIFSLVMRDPEICLGILKLAIPDEEFSEIRIMKSPNPLIDEQTDAEASLASANGEKGCAQQEARGAGFPSVARASHAVPSAERDSRVDTSGLYAETQKTLKFTKDMHGVRFDAYIKSENLWAEIEMQTASGFALGKRSRYYQANMDLDCLKEGENYAKLKKCYVIFLCTFDYFKKDEPVYFFRSWDVQKGLPLDDFSYKIVLNTACTPAKVPEALKPLYAYLNDPKASQASSLTRRIDARVRKFNTDDWRRKYMTFEYMLNERERKGLELGREQGRAEGEAQKQREIAKRMLQENIEKSVITKVTGLSLEEIEKL